MSAWCLESSRTWVRLLPVLALFLCLPHGAGMAAGDTTAGDVRREASEAARAAADYTREEKREFQREITERIQELEARIRELDRELEKGSRAARGQIRKDMETLRRERDRLVQGLKEMKNATGRAWGDLKTGLEQAVEDLDQALSRMRERFR